MERFGIGWMRPERVNQVPMPWTRGRVGPLTTSTAPRLADSYYATEAAVKFTCGWHLGCVLGPGSDFGFRLGATRLGLCSKRLRLRALRCGPGRAHARQAPPALRAFSSSRSAFLGTDGSIASMDGRGGGTQRDGLCWPCQARSSTFLRWLQIPPPTEARGAVPPQQTPPTRPAYDVAAPRTPSGRFNGVGCQL